MTPLEIEILMHYATHANDYRDLEFSPPMVRKTIDAFKGELGLLCETKRTGADRLYDLTDRGQTFVDALQRVPLPVCKWVMPALENER